MINNWNEAQEIITDFNNEFNHTHYNGEFKEVKKNVIQCVELDKPLEIYAGQTLDLVFDDLPDKYYLYFGLGKDWALEKCCLEWLSDKHSIFFFERPFNNKVLKVLKKLLPNADVSYNKNDIYINGTKNGASLRTGLEQQIDDEYYDKDTNTILKHTSSKELSGMIYILRWDNLEGLNEVFKDSLHHQDRLNNKEPLSTLSEFLEPIGITKEDFISMLEN